MADVSKNNTTNLSTTMTCSGTSDSWTTALVVTQLFSAFFCSSMVVYLSSRLRKRAWDTPAKRFSNVFTVLFIVSSLINAILNFYSQAYAGSYNGPGSLFTTALQRYLFPVIFWYFTASLLALLFQISAPFIPEYLKKHSSRCSIFTEVTIHVLVQTVSVINILPLFQQYAISIRVNLSIIIMFTLCFFSFIVFLSLIILGLLLIKFLRNHSVNRGIKTMIFKFAFLIVIDLLFTAYYPIGSFVLPPYTFVYGFRVFYLVLSLLVVTLNYPLDTWCCKRCRKSPLREPLLRINNTEGQQTNPDSVWDHRNVPSYTATNYPNEMSDCRTDYELSQSNMIAEDGEVIL